MSESFFTWPWIPKTPMVENLSWLTNIIECYDGSEQRIRTRIAPRQSFKCKFVPNNTREYSAMMAAISGWQDKTFGVGCWHEAQSVAEVLQGATSISIDTRYADFRDSSYAFIWESVSKCEVVTISTKTDSIINISEVSQDYSGEVYVMPLRVANMSEVVDRKDYAGKSLLSFFELTFEVTDNIELETEASSNQYLDYDVYSGDNLLIGDSISVNINRDIEIIDNSTGIIYKSAKNLYPKNTIEKRWRSNSLEESWDLRKLLHRRSGRLVPMWVTSGRNDLVLINYSSSDSYNITVYDSSYRVLGVDQPTKKNIAIFSNNGSFVCRSIESVDVGSAGEEIITLDQPVGFLNIAKISFISLLRMSQDTIEITYERIGVAEVKSSMTEVAL